MFRSRKSRERRNREAALRKECAELRYISAFKALNTLSDSQLQQLLQRVATARSELEKVIYAHDDSPKRLVTSGLGAVSVVIGIVTLGAGPFLLPVTGILLGAGLVASDIGGLIGAKLDLASDEALAMSLDELSGKIKAECRARSII